MAALSFILLQDSESPGTLQAAPACSQLRIAHRRSTIFRVILIPGGLRAAYPAISSRLIHNMKNTALAAFVSVPEFFNSITTAITRSFLAIEILALAAVVYLALSIGMSLGLRRLERRLYPSIQEPAPS